MLRALTVAVTTTICAISANLCRYAVIVRNQCRALVLAAVELTTPGLSSKTASRHFDDSSGGAVLLDVDSAYGDTIASAAWLRWTCRFAFAELGLIAPAEVPGRAPAGSGQVELGPGSGRVLKQSSKLAGKDYKPSVAELQRMNEVAAQGMLQSGLRAAAVGGEQWSHAGNGQAGVRRGGAGAQQRCRPTR